MPNENSRRNKIKFCKGTRFYNKRERSKIPFIRKIGNIL